MTRNLGLVLDGSVIIESNDIWGNRTILSHVGKGEFFAETYALLENEPMLVDVTANEKCLILFIRLDLLLQRPAFRLRKAGR
ncbi:MAG: cyclic nucleotide-binding domain-containing protein [Peptoniphilaceae bacterium]|nr:cyclic nucleotide-binding domain-containing protein [Peptoniphilaceae bacterium]